MKIASLVPFRRSRREDAAASRVPTGHGGPLRLLHALWLEATGGARSLGEPAAAPRTASETTSAGSLSGSG